ncbi:energy transducer TonB [Burkholderia cepacia]|uniref:energy transducer TonB n=1 Tax=Burkholderia cepacia TaxID=292 RepID=UPI00298F6271|nr:TonB family protein [Burkholderia cepacia]MDW9250445.1 tonB family C-terminal domain protein [Burkholderia cepacia]
MTTASPSRLAAIGRPRRFGNRQTHPVRRFGGIAIAIALHLVLIWALVNGLATRVVQIVQQPIEARIIAPVKPPPPPPPPKPVEKVVSKPRVTAPPPPFVPPPEVHVQAPPPATITHQDVPAPSAPVHEAPPAPVPVAKPVNREIGVVCPNSDEVRASIVYPPEAQDNNITGEVTVEFTVDPDGRVTNLRVAQPADPVLNRAALNAVKRFNCIAQGQSVRVRVPFSFNLN